MFKRLFGGSTVVGPVEQLDPQSLQARLAQPNPPQLIDVRSSEEYAHDGRIAGSKLIPLPTLAQRLTELDKTRPVVLVCRSGNRSQVAADLLVGQGFNEVANLRGGMIGWQRAGLPTR